MNEQQLKELALKAQQYPLGTMARRVALSKLIDSIYRSSKLCHPYRGQFPKVYKHIYEEAVQDLFLYLCKNIDKYDPQRGEFMTWVNMLLSQRFFKEAIPKIVGKSNEIQLENSFLENLEDLTIENDEENYISQFRKIREYIEKDSRGIFRQTHITNHPKANFQEIAIKRWSGTSWKAISDELGIPIPTLSNFYRRSLEKFRYEFRDFCELKT
ncbi:sigma-70 family RNA polymerase sigma factor [Scytonema sp. UIC 10036]|uniref:sigma factor n=1 Tax=Scytonema sp. UIC 10036 TaxID=2304196 RepID=UPI0012DA8E93|nr:sigma factor [Scytonema sp. UIC 10036]MUG91322.1 sigma-70 family RNA polymerase sigma factor [Scytonema sp. UIC 10036]